MKDGRTHRPGLDRHWSISAAFDRGYHHVVLDQGVKLLLSRLYRRHLNMGVQYQQQGHQYTLYPPLFFDIDIDILTRSNEASSCGPRLVSISFAAALLHDSCAKDTQMARTTAADCARPQDDRQLRDDRAQRGGCHQSDVQQQSCGAISRRGPFA
jgi:hypothetical protein